MSIGNDRVGTCTAAAAATTVVPAVLELLAGLGSVCVAEARTVFVRFPLACGETRIVAVALAPLASVPMEQVTMPLDWAQLP